MQFKTVAILHIQLSLPFRRGFMGLHGRAMGLQGSRLVCMWVLAGALMLRQKSGVRAKLEIRTMQQKVFASLFRSVNYVCDDHDMVEAQGFRNDLLCFIGIQNILFI